MEYLVLLKKRLTDNGPRGLANGLRARQETRDERRGVEFSRIVETEEVGNSA